LPVSACRKPAGRSARSPVQDAYGAQAARPCAPCGLTRRRLAPAGCWTYERAFGIRKLAPLPR
jgi:hypothetical protein